MKLSKILSLTNGKYLSRSEDHEILYLNTDSRTAFDTHSGLFFAIDGEHHDGHTFVNDLIKTGFKNFIVEKQIAVENPDVNIIQVESSLKALQCVAAFHRSNFKNDVLAITGSNGKTIVKEWLAQLVSEKLNVCKSPKSYNSQIGVPLSVWNLKEENDLGIFEAGISMPNEMHKLQLIIKPTHGILTNIGSAHEEYFESIEQKLEEKLRLFEASEVLFHCNDKALINEGIAKMRKQPKKVICWGFNINADLKVSHLNNTLYRFETNKETFDIKLLSNNETYLENILHCICFAYFTGFKPFEIQKGIEGLKPITMRLELKKGINNTYLVDDTYNNDLAGFETALDFLGQQKHYNKKTIIISDILQTGSKKETYQRVAELIVERAVDQVYAIGSELKAHANFFPKSTQFFETTASFLEDPSIHFEKEVILIKGARRFGFEKIVKQLMERVHNTVLEINLDAITHNLNIYRKLLRPKTKLLIMVKALAYGSGGAEIANLLQFHKVDYLGVAYVDEGVQLRNAGIKIPIMVINPSEDDLENLIHFNIEPEIYSLNQLKIFSDFYKKKGMELCGHFTINTGMNRLGFNPESVDALIEQVKLTPNLKVQSVYTHLAAADEDEHLEFSLQQIKLFTATAEKIESSLGIKTIKHALNSAGITRFPNYQFDMVRLGIGLYGIEPNGNQQNELKPISTLKTKISQIRSVKKGESVGYGRKGKVDHDMRIATIAIGYADGFSRIFSNGNGEVMVNGKLAKVVGNVCMDMTMIDISNIEAEEGDAVIIFGEQPSIIDLAKKANTIPYEILTNVSDRVKRVYYTG
ncbi:MAG: bifunctional UDP-N-acetylmuramoyl-tripeptide:D-alanyl-D-alanine ligase/alanine racemase [Cytophagales bacterium CG12_big_fil_rev_8_21_14_0_65_40_12]|nr:MAG: bifunctional UDP-N-acetylmuramoyl-tripeptide:D-alanyl-D-alanine ligase/alanine racemase [Cytophagales bacterium CG12_big_fil_rev_8_21_14_0_65_40_12]PIW05776.1 MAG: bifunctional UDP-N-acetylmuramoyl-tripeptide:D-alanyl-D-alanine ligase/alanine racemase [Cytophagales bacterium CG17_big_fil_post_rev_8_21_14_2_50_40_13]